jgi:hypothetical protein
MTRNKNIGFVQLNNGFAGQHYLPLASGMLAATLAKQSRYKDEIRLKTPAIFFERIECIVQRMADCDIVGFSVYVWNERASLEIARALKMRSPDIIIIFGGPQVPNSRKQFRRIRTKELNQAELVAARSDFTQQYHLDHPFIDYCVHGEGEMVFVSLVDAIIENGRYGGLGLPSVSGLDTRGKLVYPFVNPRLDSVVINQYTASPILDGYFDQILDEYPKQRWALMYETDRGCPYQCTYCDWGGATEDKVVKFDLRRIEQEIDWIGRNQIEYVFLCNANFGINKQDVQISELFVEVKEKFGFPKFVSTQNAKNPKPHTLRALQVLHDGGMNKAAVMSQQSLNAQTLVDVRRDNMQLGEYYTIQASLAAQGVYTMTDLIFPMPSETQESLKSGIDVLVENGQYNRIQFNNLSVLVNTEMGNPEYQKTHGFVLKSTPIINPHGARTTGSEMDLPQERQILVIGTNTMPVEKWVAVRAFCWMFNLLFFNKLLQIPLLICSKVLPFKITSLVDLLVEKSIEYGGLIGSVHSTFVKYANDIAHGEGNEFIYDEDALGIYWPPDELAFIRLAKNDELGQLYHESRSLLIDLLDQRGNTNLNPVMIDDAISLNNFLLRLPNSSLNRMNKLINLNYDLVEWYWETLKGLDVKLPRRKNVCYAKDDRDDLDFNEWCKGVVWYGSRRGEYLASAIPLRSVKQVKV